MPLFRLSFIVQYAMRLANSSWLYAFFTEKLIKNLPGFRMSVALIFRASDENRDFGFLLVERFSRPPHFSDLL
jgi:hypothetical protein